MSVQNELPLNSPTATRFWHFNQNNSGGGFVQDHERGLAPDVIIEAQSARQANEIAESIGIYFNGCDAGIDCDCCGDRWYPARGEGDAVPTLWSQDCSSGTYDNMYTIWMEDGIEGYIHYLDGRKVQIKPRKVPYVSPFKA